MAGAPWTRGAESRSIATEVKRLLRQHRGCAAALGEGLACLCKSQYYASRKRKEPSRLPRGTKQKVELWSISL
ncbi:hypothetical protein EYF80_066967 [Liparis tanakae]|uniref:Uncharacterized protein n=1 Tax=Liparis tanakae TaxID=230148 RepID=A0A4Z2E2F4_9TELE|nr:hypothetical protein EYF80_066967 [Liparis tanakae]